MAFRKEIEEGGAAETFEELATEESHCSSHRRGGDLGEVLRGKVSFTFNREPSAPAAGAPGVRSSREAKCKNSPWPLPSPNQRGPHSAAPSLHHKAPSPRALNPKRPARRSRRAGPGGLNPKP